jgi:hypothetical protein
MVSDPHRPGAEDERDDLAALDFFGTPDDATDSDLDALDFAAVDAAGAVDTPPAYTVANPLGTVAVTTFLDGRVQHIELTSEARIMTEADLADEIVVIARLAIEQAKAAQYAYMLDGMRQQGHDDAAARDFLTRDLDLPTPEQAQAAQAQLLATRYGGDHD